MTTDGQVMNTLIREMGLVEACRYAMRKRDIAPHSEVGQQYGRVLVMLHETRPQFGPNPPDWVRSGRHG